MQRRVAVVSGLFAAGVVLLLTIHGPGLTQDAATYEAAAKSLRELDGVVASDGSAMVVYPPGYPVILMVLSLAGMSIRTAARLVGAAALGVLVTTMLLFVLPRVRHRVPAVALVAAGTGLSGSLLMFATYQLSDVLFVAMVLVALTLLARRYTGISPWANTVAMTLAAIVPLVRYIGVALPVVAAFTVLDAGRGGLPKRLLKSAAVFGLLMTPTLLWVVRNYAVSGTSTGARGTDGFPALSVLEAFGGTVLHWLVPSAAPLPPPLPAIAGAALPVVTALVAAATYLSVRVRRDLRPLLLFILVYLGLLWHSELSYAIESVSARYMLPVFVPVLTLGILAVDRLASGLGDRAPRWTKAALIAGVLLAFVPVGLETGRFAISAVRDGTGYFVPESKWAQSPVIKDLRTRSPGAKVYSNENAQVYLFAGRYTSEPPSFLYMPATPEAQRWALASAEQGALLAWLHAPPPQFPTVTVDGRRVSLETVASYPDGTIQRFVARPQ